MCTSFRARLAAVAAALVLGALWPATALAAVSGPCAVTASADSDGLNRSNGFIGTSQTPFPITVAPFVAFAAVSIAFWASFRFWPLPLGEAADSIETETAALT